MLTALTTGELATYLPNTLLRDTDAMSMAHSLEVRVPYVDHHVVESACQLPSRFKMSSKGTKLVLRAAFRDIVRGDLLAPGKLYFSMPLTDWVAGCLFSRIANGLRTASDLGLVNRDTAAGLACQARAGGGRAAYTVAVLAEWLETHGVETWA